MLRRSKIFMLPLLLLLAASCSTTEKFSSLIEEDKLYVTRIFIGNFIDYQHTSPDRYGNPDLIWVTTTLDSIHGKISAFSKECKFSKGERLYMRRVIVAEGKEDRWAYLIENSSSVGYKINEYQNHKNVIVETLFDAGPDTRLPLYVIPPGNLARETEVTGTSTTGGS